MYTLLGAEVSLYTGKVRAYLRYKRIPFTEVVASAEVYRTVIIPKTGVSYIPVLLTPDGETAVQDTTDIIDFLERRFPTNPIYPATPCQRLVSLLFEVYADEWLVIPAMHYRWSFPENLDFIYREFGRTNLPDASASAQGKKVAAKFAGSLPFLGVSDQTKAAIEEWFETFLGQLDAHFAQHAFLLGGRPTLGDFGLMGPLYAHISRDPYPGRLLRAKAPHVVQWLERMQFNHPPALAGVCRHNGETLRVLPGPGRGGRLRPHPACPRVARLHRGRGQGKPPGLPLHRVDVPAPTRFLGISFQVTRTHARTHTHTHTQRKRRRRRWC
ncbi:glutathione Stransferase [Acanthamoeba castellanii str. Neff]|uniref:Glutathione Stransferase n=1 Tax=Acanthamoeba castellanii (strain ATCC 30010 / Neff) TaxID=1257118 RepID=L8GNK8_ACACF|nr:glutathione Stransferase [Acanthamoeba castellanii str. Neff]ELR14562.1 glutathione Stransferase [Acanthamoeba castellanii str. Neff]